MGAYFGRPGYCGCRRLSDDPNDSIASVMDPRQKKKKYERYNYIYTVTFPSKPLLIKVTSRADGKRGFITGVAKNSPVAGMIELNSKIVGINGKSLKGLYVDEISKILEEADVPIHLTLVRPEALKSTDRPDPNPKEVEEKIQASE